MKSANIVVLSLVASLLASCAEVPLTDETLPLPDVAGHWQSSLADTQQGHAIDGWLDEMNYPELTGYVKKVLRQNPNFKAVALRMEATGFNKDIVAASLYPTLSGSFQASRTRPGGASAPSNNLQLGLSSRWEIDVWGRLTADKEGAVADFLSSKYNYEALRLSLAAQVSQAWFDAIEAREQLELSIRTVQNFEKTVRIVRNRYNRGLTDGLDVRLTQSNLEQARASLSQARNSYDVTRRSLKTLAGEYPSTDIEAAGRLPDTLNDVPVGLPMDILERRPDLRSAKMKLLSAGYSSQSADKNLLPSFALTASGNNNSDNFGDLLKFDNIFWNLIGNITQPIFQGGRLRAQAKAQERLFEAEKESFATTLLSAFQEVENALSGEKYLKERVEYTRQAAFNAMEAEKVALDQYSRGLIKISILLQSQRQSLNQQGQLLSVKRQRIRNRIALHLALGGDFSSNNKVMTEAQKAEGII